MSIKEIVKDNKVRFLYYRKGELWYEVIGKSEFCDDSQLLIFPVPLDDTGDGTFYPEDKAIYFMRYIRKYLGEAAIGE